MTFQKRFTVIAAILISSTCFGQVEGKGIICDSEEWFAQYETIERLIQVTKGYYFDSSAQVAEQTSFIRDSDRYWVSTHLFWRGSTSASAITSGDNSTQFTFHRKTGGLEQKSEMINGTYLCKVFLGESPYRQEIERVLRSMQFEYNEKREDNEL